MITFTIDTLTPCLKETSTGEIYETEVIRLKRKSFLAKFNKRTGWYVNWSKFEEDVEVYEYSCAVTPLVRQTGNRLSRPTETVCASLLA